MKIVIVGGGKVGEVLCSELSLNHDIVLIEKDSEKLDRLITKFDITGIVGHGADYAILQSAQVKNADIFITVTQMDEVNIISAILAKQMGAKYTIARVRNPEYSTHNEKLKRCLNINTLINPELAAAREIGRVLRYPSAISLESFAGKREVSLVELEIGKSSMLDGLSLKQFRTYFNSVLVCIIQRENEIFIPKGDSVLKAGDRIFISGISQDMTNFFRRVVDGDKQVNSTMIVGGGRITYYLLDFLKHTKIEAKIIEHNQQRCKFLASVFPFATIVHADGTDHDVLDAQLIEDYDAFISLTGVDEENLVMSVYAKHQGVNKIITKMNRNNILKVINNPALRKVVSPKQIIANEIIRVVRARANSEGSNVEALYRVADNRVEILQFKLNNQKNVVNIPLTQLLFKQNVLIAFVIRDGNILFPKGEDVLLANDSVIVVTTEKNCASFEDILEH